MAEQETNLSAAYQLRRQARGAEPPPKERRWLRRLIFWGSVFLGLILLGAVLWIWWAYTHVATVSARLSGVVLEISPKTDGQLVKKFVSEGARVKEGQQLLQLDDTELRATLEAAEATMAVRVSEHLQAKAALSMTRLLRASGVQQARALVEVAEARRGEARAQLERLKKGTRQEEIDAAKARLESAQALQALRDLEVQQSKDLVDEGIESKHALEIARTQLTVQKSAVRQAELALQRLEAGATEEELAAVEQQLAAREAEVKEARAQLMLAETRQGEVAVAEEAVKAAEKQLERAQHECDRQRSALDDAHVLSPADGLVTRVFPEVGEFCRQGAGVIFLADESKAFYVYGYVREKDAPLVGIGQPARIRIMAGPRRYFDGEVTQISEHTQSQDSSGGEGGPAAQGEQVWVKIGLREELPAGLKHGMTARVVIKVR